jgi:tetratricopeptide (TPR) repeat protein
MTRAVTALCCAFIIIGAVTAVNVARAQQNETGQAEGAVQVLIREGDRYFSTGDLAHAIQAYGSAAEKAPNDPEVRFKLGLALGRANKYQEAIEQLEKALSLAPNNVRVLRTLAGAYEVAGMIEKAQEAYQQVMGATTNPEIIADAHKRFVLITAKEYAQDGNTDAALKLLDGLRRQQGEDPEVIYYIGVTQMLADHLDAAETAFKRIIELLPGNRNAYQNLIKVYERERQFDKAIAAMEKLLKTVDPQSKEYQGDNLQLQLMKGRYALEKGDLDKAMAAFQKASTIDPRNPFVNFNIGLINQQQGRWNEAEKSFGAVLAVMPDNLDAKLRLATVYIETNQIQKAVTQLEDLITNAGNTPQGQQAKALLARLQASLNQQQEGGGSLDTQIAQLEELVKQNPNDVEKRMQLAALYLRKRENDKAKEQYLEVIKLEPSNESAHGTLGTIYDDGGLYNDAMEQYAIAVSLEGDPQRAAGIARFILLALGKRDFTENKLSDAQRVFNQVLDMDPDNQIALLFTGLIYSNNSELEDSVAAFQRLLRNNPNHLPARINLGLVYERLNREDDAIREYRYILEQSPDSRIGEEAKRRLKIVEKRIKGLFSTMDYRIVYDSNSNLSSQSSQEYRTDVSLNFSYRYKADNDIRYAFTWAPQYSTYHVGQFDYLTNNLTLSLSRITARRTIAAGITHAIQNTLLTDARVSTSNTLFLESSELFRMPSIMAWDPDKPVDSSVRVDYFYSDLDAGSSGFFSARTTSIGMSFDQNVAFRKILGLSYFYTRNRNKEDIGSDNAYNSHRLSVNFQSGFTSKNEILKNLSASATYSLFYYTYVNPDSFSNFTKRRVNTTHLLSAGLTYGFRPNINFYLSAFYQVNDSNLPVGFVFSARDRVEGLQGNAVGTPIGLQSTSLGDFSRQTITVGMNWNF